MGISEMSFGILHRGNKHQGKNVCMYKCVCANTHAKTIYVLFLNFFVEKEGLF